MKFNVCMTVALCLLFAGCTKSEQAKTENLEQHSESVTPGAFGPETNQGSGFGSPGGRGPGGGSFDPAARFNANDTDGDGKLTGDEIPERWKDDLEAIDADKDGAITLEEQQQWFQARFAEGGFGKGPGGGGTFGGPGFGSDPRNSEEYKAGKHRPEIDE